jgi:surfactin synthase thioesterase subunit
LGGIPPEILDNPDIFNYYVPILRSDFGNLETFIPRAEYEVLDCDFILLHGDNDKIPIQAVKEWSNYTSRSHRIEVFPGGHFFINDHIEQIADVMKSILADFRT